MADIYLYDKKPKILILLKKAGILLLESALVVLAAWLIIRYALAKTVMVGDSMGKTLNDGDVILINRLSYLKSEPKRNDVIVFNQGSNEHSYNNVKRVIGVPGDTVEIINGSVYINGEEFEEVIDTEKMKVSGLADSPIELQENEFFVLGDNRNSSEDSRFSNIGSVVKGDIIGKAFFRISPSPAFIKKLNNK
ncbi:MAG: signal peptidase I [Lachnospiraceae bacterium]|nr:signal peptidase I [Lachnospiraceae bacterium]